MICKCCQSEYTELDKFQWLPRVNSEAYGWHPSFGECYLCFREAIFGAALEPVSFNNEGVYQEIYQITGPDKPSPPCESPNRLTWDEVFEQMEREHPQPGPAPNFDIPF